MKNKGIIMSIKLIKLVTGEEIVTELSKVENGYEMSNPARIVLSEEGLGLASVSMFSKEAKKITIDSRHVIWVLDPEDNIANAYNSQFGSGIILAKGLSPFA